MYFYSIERKRKTYQVDKSLTIKAKKMSTFKPDDIKIHSDRYLVVLRHSDWDSDIDIDELTKIDYSNLYGEMVTVSALMNRIGILKSDVESNYNLEKLELNVFKAQKRKSIEAKETALGNKITEKKLDSLVAQDPEVIAFEKKVIYAYRDLQTVDSMYWAIQSKDKKLNNLLKPVTPEEFTEEIIEGKINTFFVKKFKKQL